MINVGVEGWGGDPVGEAESVDLIEEGPLDRPPLPSNPGTAHS
jgi:hypothetical protein